ncbi:MAG: hypothetical protein COA69_03040 [Robiginitomaculum sp.]|nr:MAG: hypothetical protein COA69_03040 [Robiginitomaculum sp.]
MTKTVAIKRPLKTIMFVALTTLSVSAQAGVVRVGAGGGASHGHGYVFGSSSDGSCWLATPAHVLRATDGSLTSNVLHDAQGRSGVAVNPIQPDMSVDLAFARVTGLGRTCLDRLTIRRLDSVLEAGSDARLNLIDTATSGARFLPMRIRTADGGVKAIKFSVEPVPSSANKNPKIQQGFSGGLIDRNGAATLGGGDLPLGLVLSVCDSGSAQGGADIDFDDLFGGEVSKAPKHDICGAGHYATVLRMDEIRRLFAEMEASTIKPKQASSAKNNIRLLNFTGETISGTPDGLIAGSGCWTVKPDKKGRITLDYLLPDNVQTTAVSIQTCDGDGNLGGVEVRGGAEVNNTTAYRYCSASHASINCTVGSRKVKVVQLNVSPKSKHSPLKLRSITVQTNPI